MYTWEYCTLFLTGKMTDLFMMQKLRPTSELQKQNLFELSQWLIYSLQFKQHRPGICERCLCHFSYLVLKLIKYVIVTANQLLIY